MKLTLELAKKLAESTDKEIRDYALSNFPQLKNYPKWRDLYIKGWYIDGSDGEKDVIIQNYTDLEVGVWANNKNKDVWPTKELAEAALALAQLTQLRDAYNMLDSSDFSNTCYYIWKMGNGALATSYHDRTSIDKLLVFNTLSSCEQFLVNNKELLEIAKPLL